MTDSTVYNIEHDEVNVKKKIEISSMVDEIISNEPAVTAEPADITTDSNGTLFDEEKHQTLKSGLPALTNVGNFKRKRQTKKDGGGTDPVVDNKVPAAILSNYTIMGLVTIMGEDFKPEKKDGIDERKMLTEAYKDYLDSKGDIDIPPGFALLGALSLYIAPRLQKETTAKKIGKVWGWIKKKIGL